MFILAGSSTTLEGKKYTCPKKTETFECDAAKRVPEEFNRGTSYKINDLKNPSDEKSSEIYCRKERCIVQKNKLYGRVQVLEKNATRMTFRMLNLDDSLRFSCDVHTAPEYQVTEFHTKDFTAVECKLNYPQSRNDDVILKQVIWRGCQPFYFYFLPSHPLRLPLFSWNYIFHCWRPPFLLRVCVVWMCGWKGEGEGDGGGGGEL